MQVDHHFSVIPSVLLATLTDPVFLAARNERYGGAGAPTVTRDEHGGVAVVVPRQLPLEHVPSAFHRFVGNGRFTEHDSWSPVDTDRVDGAWTVRVGRAPIRLEGTHEVVRDGSGCLHRVRGLVTVSIPMVGRRLAREVDAHLEELVTHEMRFTARWLGRDAPS